MPLSDILSCDETMVEAAITSERPYTIGDWYLAKGISTIELSKLGEMLKVSDYDSLMSGFELVGEPLPEGPWPERIPEVLTAKLRTITDEEIAHVCQPWAKIEEFFGTVAPADLVPYLTELRGFLAANHGPYFVVNAL